VSRPTSASSSRARWCGGRRSSRRPGRTTGSPPRCA
jgi:hypothetical protein